MNRWEQIIRRIHLIYKKHHLIPESVRLYHRPCICCRKYQKNHKADRSGYKISSKKPAHLFFFLSGHPYIIHNPEQITSQINKRRRRPQRNPSIQGTFNIIMSPFPRNNPCPCIHRHIECEREQQRYQMLFRDYSGYHLFFRHITLLSLFHHTLCY